ncbi:MAG: STAS/SEC14 domain-containing protein [Miltoncostaeaceae bacterium]
MLQTIDGLPHGVIGVRATGVVSAADYTDVLVPLAERAIAGHGSVRCLFVIGPERVHFTSGAMFQDAKLGASRLRSWKRVAVVADSRVVDAGARITRWVFPDRMRVFRPSEEAAAREWAAA